MVEFSGHFAEKPTIAELQYVHEQHVVTCLSGLVRSGCRPTKNGLPLLQSVLSQLHILIPAPVVSYSVYLQRNMILFQCGIAVLSAAPTDDLSSEGISGSGLQSRRNIRRLLCVASMQVSWLAGRRRFSVFPEFIPPVTLLKIRSLLTVAVPHRILTGFPFHLPAGQSKTPALRHMKAYPIDFRQ